MSSDSNNSHDSDLSEEANERLASMKLNGIMGLLADWEFSLEDLADLGALELPTGGIFSKSVAPPVVDSASLEILSRTVRYLEMMCMNLEFDPDTLDMISHNLVVSMYSSDFKLCSFLAEGLNLLCRLHYDSPEGISPEYRDSCMRAYHRFSFLTAGICKSPQDALAKLGPYKLSNRSNFAHSCIRVAATDEFKDKMKLYSNSSKILFYCVDFEWFFPSDIIFLLQKNWTVVADVTTEDIRVLFIRPTAFIICASCAIRIWSRDTATFYRRRCNFDTSFLCTPKG